MFVLRIMGAPPLLRLLEVSSSPHLKRRIVACVERFAPDVAKHLKLEALKQNSEKFERLRDVHTEALNKLQLFETLPTRATSLVNHRQRALKVLGDHLLRSYLALYEFPARSDHIRHIFGDICDLLEDNDVGFVARLTRAIERVDDLLGAAATEADFFAVKAYRPFLQTAHDALVDIEVSSAERFKCSIRPKRQPPNVVERRFPLHDANRSLRVSIPLVNEGPGTAIDVQVTIVSGSEAVSTERIDIDTVEPGEFAISLDLLIGEPTERIPLFFEIEWSTARNAERQSISFDAYLQSQNPDVPWESLEAVDPYGTEVAEGDEFVGRRAKVLSISGRLLKPRMQSSYITGQKRVGKTSLAFAVRDYVRSHPLSEKETEFVYLEYGGYAAKDADACVERLGKVLAERLLSQLPYEPNDEDFDFRGSLAPLSDISQRLQEHYPDRRFVIVLDEFDAINPDMYRYGPLAEAFFANIRTLSAKTNLAFILIGGENMPFIISAQGDQLNKFVREPLDYFSRSEEWTDFEDLVRSRGRSPLNWHESALHEIFRLSNGHPYYAKLLCARIFQNAVAERDTDVTVEEVGKALTALTSSLDVNAFAHFWKDGISAGREAAEVIQMKRRKLLVAIGQTLRRSQPTNLHMIAINARPSGLSPSDLVPLLGDLVRREILRLEEGEYGFILPLFGHWLIQRGADTLIADTLGEEMADLLRAREDVAFVRDSEIAEVIGTWPLYRGRSISIADVRQWLDQCESLCDRRLLFKLLENLRFIGEEEARAMLQVAHSVVKSHTSAFTPDTRAHRRYDIIVTHVEGPGKAGARYASRYAEANLISAMCVVEQRGFSEAVSELEKRRGGISGVVIIDDLAATGDSLINSVSDFVSRHRQFLEDNNVPLIAISLIATAEGAENIRSHLFSYENLDLDFKACELLSESHFPFGGRSRLWEDEDERGRAKELVTRMGQQMNNDNPLGYATSGLLVVFGDTCPVNSLPILHSSSRDWRPLFPRSKV